MMAKHTELMEDSQSNGLRGTCETIGIGCRGFIGKSLCRACNVGVKGAKRQFRLFSWPLRQQKLLYGSCGAGGESNGWVKYSVSQVFRPEK